MMRRNITMGRRYIFPPDASGLGRSIILTTILFSVPTVDFVAEISIMTDGDTADGGNVLDIYQATQAWLGF
jgi:hypothetical protein